MSKGTAKYNYVMYTQNSLPVPDQTPQEETAGCKHVHRTLQPDGNIYRCNGCNRVAGFVRLPAKKKPT